MKQIFNKKLIANMKITNDSNQKEMSRQISEVMAEQQFV
jgi:hypothetical protein